MCLISSSFILKLRSDGSYKYTDQLDDAFIVWFSIGKHGRFIFALKLNIKALKAADKSTAVIYWSSKRKGRVGRSRFIICRVNRKKRIWHYIKGRVSWYHA